MKNDRHSKAHGTHTICDFDAKVEIVQDDWPYHSTTVLEKWSHCQNIVWLSLSPMSLFLFFLCLSMIPIFLYKLFSQRTKSFGCEWELYENDYSNY